MLIGVCGYGYSGSGAVLDFLREIEDCSFVETEFEFLLLYNPGGIEDLEYHLMERPTRYFSSDAAIKDFMKMIHAMNYRHSDFRKYTGDGFLKASEEFIQNITQIKWKGIYHDSTWRRDQPFRSLMGRMGRLVNLYEKVFKRKWRYKDDMYISVKPHNFYEGAHDYLYEVMALLGYDLDKIVLLDQPFDVYELEKSMKYFDDPMAIIVDRDPRDIYVLAKKILLNKASWIPSDDVNQFIQYHKLVRQSMNTEDPPNVIRLKYEDFIYQYEKTTYKLLSWLGLQDSARDIKKYFDPEISIENTQLFLKYPDLQEDIKKIETELPEYLYHFENAKAHPKGIVQSF